MKDLIVKSKPIILKKEKKVLCIRKYLCGTEIRKGFLKKIQKAKITRQNKNDKYEYTKIKINTGEVRDMTDWHMQYLPCLEHGKGSNM